MRRFVLLLALATTVSAAVIRGTIVENRTGKPLSRVSVALQPIVGTPGSRIEARTNNFGGFEFQSLAGGSYLLKASRRGFLPLEYGQKLWNSAGQPIVLADDGSAFLNLRLMRFGGITGAIVDENDIGLTDHEVVAYRNTVPPELVARGKSDDRGMYRISGLEPGVYLAGGLTSMPLTARRKDLAGVGPATALKLTNNSALLAPGRWEVSLLPPPGNYVSGFYGPGIARTRSRPDGWNEFLSNGMGSSVRFTLSGGPGEVHGVVKSYGDPVVGAPVYLEAYDPETRARLLDLRTVRTDIHGLYRFQGLAPGIYRVLSTFEYNMPDTAAMELAGAQSVRVEARSDLQMDLDLYGIR